jgi:two-component system osmolarity sensor histidine kinase EnvZ
MRFKKFIPQSLYGRFLLIIVLPILIIQLVSIYVFYYTHLDVISKHMARNVITEMAFIKKSVAVPEYNNLLQGFSKDIDLNFSFQENRRLKKKSKIGDSDWKKNPIYKYINPLIDPYNRFKSELKIHGLTPYEIYEDPDDDDTIIVKVQTEQGIISFDVPIKRITSSSAYVFTFWIILTAIITALISIIFLKNQIRSIRDLSKSAEKFGRGQDVPNLKPTGSQEIRSLAISFIKMKERVKRQIAQRTDMLSAVSHDLRTPLTRMKLQLEMMGNSSETHELKQDIGDMEKLVEEYLDFARSDEKEKFDSVKIKNFLQEKIISYYAKMNRNIGNFIDLKDNFEIPIKQLAFKRALMNLVDNGFNYGKQVNLSASLSNNNLMITIDDDGPGIPIHERGNVFKPFYRIDNSRNLDKKSKSSASSIGSGLGLAIALDAVTSQGGYIKLADSPLGGLRVLIFIPI